MSDREDREARLQQLTALLQHQIVRIDALEREMRAGAAPELERLRQQQQELLTLRTELAAVRAELAGFLIQHENRC
jgi:uncharacterized protein (UPF0147 family)